MQLLIVAVLSCLTIVSGCLTGTTIDESLGDELLCSCGAMVVRCGAKPDPYVWYVRSRPYAYVEQIYVEWRWLEDETTHERFFSFANDLATVKQRRQGITRFRTYEEMLEHVASAIRTEMKRSGTSWPHDMMRFYMSEKIGFPENSPLPFKEYYEEHLERYTPIGCTPVKGKKYEHGEVIEAIPGFVQHYSGYSISNGWNTAYIVRKEVRGFEVQGLDLSRGRQKIITMAGNEAELDLLLEPEKNREAGTVPEDSRQPIVDQSSKPESLLVSKLQFLPLSERWGEEIFPGFNCLESDITCGTFDAIRSKLKAHSRKHMDEIPCFTRAFEWNRFLLVQSWYGAADANHHDVRIRVYKTPEAVARPSRGGVPSPSAAGNGTPTIPECWGGVTALSFYDSATNSDRLPPILKKYFYPCCDSLYSKIYDAYFYDVTSFKIAHHKSKLFFLIDVFSLGGKGCTCTLDISNFLTTPEDSQTEGASNDT